MSARILITGFQSIENAEILVDGFTAVTGPNNSGKTSVMRAVQGVFSNSPGDAFVRHGAERLSVELTLGDRSVRWSKGPKLKPTYVVDGKELNPGRGVPSEVLGLGVQPVQAGSLEVWPQIAPQFTGQVFLLDLPGSALAEAVADVDRVGRLTQALRLAEGDKRSAAAESKLRAKDVQRYKDDLESMAGLEAVEFAVASVECLLVDASAAAAEALDLQALKVRLVTSRTDVARFEGFTTISIPTSDAAEAEAALLRDLQSIQVRLKNARDVVVRLGGITAVQIPAKPDEALDLREQIKQLGFFKTNLEKTRKRMADSTAAMEASKAMITIDEPAQKAQKMVQSLAWLRDVVRRRSKNVKDMSDAQVKLAQVQQEAAASVAEVHQILGTRGECPVCLTQVS